MMQRHYWRTISWVFPVFVFFSACQDSAPKELKVLGPFSVEDGLGEDGEYFSDTIYSQVRPFLFTDQDGKEVTEHTFDGKLYVTDFFFTSCPTICPKMKQQMLRVYEEFNDEPNLLFLSHSIDPKRDSVGRLHDFAEKLGIESKRWHMVTGDRDSIYSMARHYLIAAQEDPRAPGGFAHSGAFLLIDQNRQIRGIYDGVDPVEVDRMMADIRYLLSQPKSEIKR